MLASTRSVIQAKNVKFGSTTCSTTHENGAKTGYSTASPVNLRSAPKSGGRFQPTFSIQSSATATRKNANRKWLPLPVSASPARCAPTAVATRSLPKLLPVNGPGGLRRNPWGSYMIRTSPRRWISAWWPISDSVVR